MGEREKLKQIIDGLPEYKLAYITNLILDIAKTDNKLPRSKLRGISLDLASLGIFVKRSKLRGIRPVSD